MTHAKTLAAICAVLAAFAAASSAQAEAWSTFDAGVSADTDNDDSIPEPEAYALVLSGLAAVGVIARGRKDY